MIKETDKRRIEDRGRKYDNCTATSDTIVMCSILLVLFIIISIQPLGQFGSEPETNQATGMALVRCKLGKFLRVVCHCFPPRLDVPTFAARCLHVRNDARDPSSERWNYGRERFFR